MYAKDLNRHLFKGDKKVTIRHMKICATSLVIKEMQVKTTLREVGGKLKGGGGHMYPCG